jgi:hypothetical protein
MLVASTQLQITQSIISAIRTADLSQAGNKPVQIDQFCPRPCLTPTPHYTPRRILHPTPRILPRPVLHPTPRYEPKPPCPPCEKTRAPHIVAPPPPPWKSLPPAELSRVANVIKIAVRQSDTIGKGNLIDLFV